MVAFLLLWTLHATEVRPLAEAIDQRATGTLHFDGRDDTFRDATLYYQDGHYRISIAGMPTIVLDETKVSTSVRRHGKGDWDIVFYSWSNSNLGWSVDIMIRSDEILEAERVLEKLPVEVQLPRARVKIMEHMFHQLAIGHFFSADQAPAPARLTTQDVVANPGKSVSFHDVNQACADKILADNRIRVRE